MYLSPLVTLDYNEARRNRLARLLLGSSIIASASLGSKNFYNFEKISTDQDKTALLEAYKKLREDCDKKAYSVKWLDDIGDKITGAITPVIRPIVKSVQGVTSATKPLSEQAERAAKGLAGTTASHIFDDRFYKIAKFSNSNFDEIKFIEKQILLFASEEGIYADSLEELSNKINVLTKEAGVLDYIGKGLKGIGKSLGGMTLKSIPFIGIVTDLTLMCKNIYEAWNNGKKIILELPLNKYGISYNEALIPTPSNTGKVSKQLKDLCLSYKDSPADLSNILSISQTLKGYSTDFVSTITNLLMVILDILEFTGLGLLVSFVLSIPIMAVEMANDTLVEEAYDKSIFLIKEICNQKITELSQGVDSKALSESIPDDQKDFMRKFLQQSEESGDTTNAASPDEPSLVENKAARINKLNNLMKVCHQNSL